MKDLPAGTVTFLFTDIEGSTQLLYHLAGDYARLLEDHRTILREAIQKWGGKEVDTQGDAFFIAFQRAADAVQAAILIQQTLTTHIWPQDATVRVRMGLHTGEPTLAGEGYIGIDVHRAARICAVAHGGQILLSAASSNLIEQYLPNQVSLRDLGNHRLKDLQRPERIFQVMCPGLSVDFPPLKSLDARPNNLPIQLTSFVGREKDINEVVGLLEHSHLVTLAGPGGAGKTRLALQIAAMSLDHSDGAWFIELAALTEGSFIPKAVASALKIAENTHQPLLQTLCETLENRSLVLLIDNCEHLVEAVAGNIVSLLQACPRLKVLATSREILNIPGESVFNVRPLSLPVDQAVLLPEDLKQSEAVWLFIDRAAACQPAFELNPQNTPSVVHICTRLDGIPLAIELAAARVRTMSVEQIAVRLDDRFHLLTGGSPTLQPRQQTLTAAIRWSYDLLTEKERLLFSRLSVFSEGWTLEMAEQVCAGNSLPMGEIMDLLRRLVDKSLVVFDPGAASSRYHFLQTIRQFAQDILKASGEMDLLEEAHFTAFYRLVLEAEPLVESGGKLEILETLDNEHDNLRSALGWALEHGRLEDAAELTGALTQFWWIRGYIHEGMDWAERAVNASLSASRHAQARAQYTLGFMKWSTNDYPQAATLWEQSYGNYLADGDKKGCAAALHFLGHALLDQGKHDLAGSYFDRSAILYRDLNDPVGLLPLIGDLGLIAYLDSHFDQAMIHFEEQIRLARAARKIDCLGEALDHMGDLYRSIGDVTRAEVCYRESLGLADHLGYQSLIDSLNHNLAHVSKDRQEYETALNLFRESLGNFQKKDDRKGMIECLEGIAETAAAMNNLELAACLFGAAETLRTSGQVQWWPANRIAYEQGLAILHEKMAPADMKPCWLFGKGLSLLQAVELALSPSPILPLENR